MANYFLFTTTTSFLLAFSLLTLLREINGMPNNGHGSPNGMDDKKKKYTPVQCRAQGRLGIPGECGKFHLCSRPGLYSKVGKCPEEELFHHQLRKCMKIDPLGCRESMCKLVDDRFPDPYGKETYLVCRFGYPEPMACPKKQIYDENHKKCVEGKVDLKSSDEEDLNDDKVALKKSWTEELKKPTDEDERKPELFDGDGHDEPANQK